MKLNFTGLFKIKNILFRDAVGAITIINLILAAVALLKDVFLASYLGTSSQADAFLLAFFLPDMAGNNLLASALGIACVPIFSRLYAANEHYRLKKSITGITVYFVFFSSLLLLIFFLARNTIIYSLGAGFNESTNVLCIELYIVMLPILLTLPLIAIGTAVLQVNNRFNLPALAPVLFNLIFLIGTLYSYFLSVSAQKGVYLLAASVLTGVLAMAALIWYAIRKYRIRIFLWLQFSELIRISPDIRDILKIFVPYLFILLFSQIVFTVERYLASNLEVGSIAGLNYAFRMAQFPLWVFVSAVSTVAFPSMSKATGAGQVEEFKNMFSKSLHLVFIVTLPLTICLFVLRVPILSILLQRGSFDANSVLITAGILAGYSLTIVSQGIVIICLRVFLAIGRIYVPLLASMVSSCLNIIFDFILVNSMGSAGLGYGAALGALINVLILFYLMTRILKLGMEKQLDSFIKIMAANLPVFFVVVLVNKMWYIISPHGGIAFRLGYAIIVVAMVLPVYLVSLRFFKVKILDLKTGGTNYAKV